MKIIDLLNRENVYTFSFTKTKPRPAPVTIPRQLPRQLPRLSQGDAIAAAVEAHQKRLASLGGNVRRSIIKKPVGRQCPLRRTLPPRNRVSTQDEKRIVWAAAQLHSAVEETDAPSDIVTLQQLLNLLKTSKNTLTAEAKTDGSFAISSLLRRSHDDPEWWQVVFYKAFPSFIGRMQFGKTFANSISMSEVSFAYFRLKFPAV